MVESARLVGPRVAVDPRVLAVSRCSLVDGRVNPRSQPPRDDRSARPDRHLSLRRRPRHHPDHPTPCPNPVRLVLRRPPMQAIDQYLPDHPFFAGLDAETTDLLAGCAVNVHVKAGEFLFHENDPADHFYVLRRGRVAVEIHTPARGVVLDTVNEGEIVGWSWMVPPYRWAFDARATLDASAVAFDAAFLRGKCDADPGMGYELMKRFVPVMDHRLQSARVRLLDLYGEFVD